MTGRNEEKRAAIHISDLTEGTNVRMCQQTQSVGPEPKPAGWHDLCGVLAADRQHPVLSISPPGPNRYRRGAVAAVTLKPLLCPEVTRQSY